MGTRSKWARGAWLLLMLLAGAPTLHSAESYTDIQLIPGAEHNVRFTSGNTIYVEGLVDGMWVGRYWAADGRINVAYELFAANAFDLEVDGLTLSQGWRWAGAQEEARNALGERHFVVELESSLHPVRLKIHTLLDGTPVLTRWLEITNTSNQAAAITAVYPWTSQLWRSQDYRSALTNPDDPVFDLGYFTESGHGWEGWFRWFPLKGGTRRIRYDVGQGANDPFFIVRNNARGEYFIGALAWTANWEMDFRSNQDATDGWAGGMPVFSPDANLWFKIGPQASAALRVVAPGATVHTPAVHLGFVEGDLDAAVQAMQAHVRQSVVPRRLLDRSFRVQYSVPCDQGYIARAFGDEEGMTEENIKKQVALAAALGAELFIVDGACWWGAYGDWTASPTRFPHGLASIADYVHGKGMLFGLYAEVEGGRGDWTRCGWCKEHPDWFFPNFKNILNLTKPEVAEHVKQQLLRMIEDYKLDLYRHDFNSPFTGELGETRREGREENDYWRYYNAWYGIMEDLHKRFPNLILQEAAAGGMRNDLGMISRWHEPYLTDGLNMPHVLQNYSGQTLALPPENFVIAFGIPSILPNRGPFDTHLRLIFSLATPWLAPVAPSLADMSPERLARYRHYVSLYKSFIRPLLPDCRMYHHAPVTATEGVDAGPWFAVEFASPDRSKGWAMIVRIHNGGPDTYVFRPRGLDPGKTYHLMFDSAGTTATVSGLQLLLEGVPIRLESEFSSQLLLLEASQ